MTKKQLRALAILYAASLIQSQIGGGFDLSAIMEPEEEDYFISELEKIYYQLANRRGLQGLNSLNCGDIYNLAQYCQEVF